MAGANREALVMAERLQKLFEPAINERTLYCLEQNPKTAQAIQAGHYNPAAMNRRLIDELRRSGAAAAHDDPQVDKWSKQKIVATTLVGVAIVASIAVLAFWTGKLARVLEGLTLAIFSALLLVAARFGQPLTRIRDGTMLFRHTVLLRGFAIFFAFGVPAGILLLLVLLRPQGDDLWWGFALCAMFAAMGLPLWWETTRYALWVSSAGLECRSPWRGQLVLPWSELQELCYSPTNQWFIAKGKGKLKIRVLWYVAGVSDFLAECEHYLPHSALTKARLGYVQLGRPFPAEQHEPVPVK